MRILQHLALVSAALLIATGPALAISGAGAIALEFNTSVRAEGMGGAGVAVPWGGEVNDWANPALLAFRTGLRYDRMESKLVPDLANNIRIHTQRVTLNAYGLGVMFAHGPMDAAYLDMGGQVATGDQGGFEGTFDSWMRARAYGFGADLTYLLRSAAGDRLPRVLDGLDVAFGVVWKEFEDDLMPDYILQDATGGQGFARAHDLGLLAQYRLLDTRNRDDGLLAGAGGLLLAASAGLSTLNTGGDYITHVDADQADPMPKMHVKGWAAHAELGFPPILRNVLVDHDHGWVADALTPLLSATYSRQTIRPGFTWNDDDDEYVYALDDDNANKHSYRGWEIAVANVYFLRRGHQKTTGTIDGDTHGWGLQIPFGRWGGLRYDKATVPQAEGLCDVTRESAGFWIDVIALLERD